MPRNATTSKEPERSILLNNQSTGIRLPASHFDYCHLLALAVTGGHWRSLAATDRQDPGIQSGFRLSSGVQDSIQPISEISA